MPDGDDAAESHQRTSRHAQMVAIVITVIVVFFSSSIKNTVQVFFVSMADSFRTSRGEFALSVSLFAIVQGVASPVIGNIADRVGAKRTILAGVALAGVTFLAAASAPWFPAFVLVYGVLGAVSLTAMSYVPIGVLVDEAFDQARRGFIYSLLTNAAAAGYILLSPIWVLFDRHGSWRVVFAALGVLFIVPLSLLVHTGVPTIKPPPPVATAPEQPSPLRAKLREILHSRTLWVLSASFFGCGVTMAFIDVHMVASFKQHGFSSTAVSLALAALGTMEVVGALLSGWLCDRVPKRLVLGASYLIRAMALAILLLSPTPLGALLFAAVFGLSYMGSVIATTLCAMDAFDRGTKGLAIGLIWTVHQFGALLSTQLGATSFDAFGSYRLVIFVTMAIAIVSGVVALTFLPDSKPRPGEDRLVAAAATS